MRIDSIRMTNFKRFTDLLIRGIPATAKLIVIVGPNGCGKSSLFDAFVTWYRVRAGIGFNDDQYYQKHIREPFNLNQTVEVKLHGNPPPLKGCLYVRTAYRNDPDFAVGGINRPTNPAEGIRVSRAIENDQAVGENYGRLIYETMAGVYDPANEAKTVGAFRQELIGEIRDSMRRVFGDLVLNNISDPLGAGGAFHFDKGTANAYHYKNLSGGEKAAFDLLLDLHVKKRFYQDAAYCIDELETHLHTKVQGTLLKELVRIVPVDSQLLVTTHSLGVLRAAQEMMAADPASVCLIDFEGLDPDSPGELIPSSIGRVTWEKLLSVTLDDLSTRIAPKTVVVCEGSSVGNRRKDCERYINPIFNGGKAGGRVGGHEQTCFFSAGEVARDDRAAESRGVGRGGVLP